MEEGNNMKKQELENLIKAELSYVKKSQSFSNLEDAKECIASEIFTENDWDYESKAMDSLEETLNNMDVVDDDNDLVWWFEFRLKHYYSYDIDNLNTLDDVELESLINIIKSIRENTIYMKGYQEYWTEF